MAIERAEHPSHLPHIPTPDIGKAFAWIKNHPTATASITALVGVPAVAIFMYISRDKGPQHPVQTADSGNVLTVPLPALEPGVVSVETATATPSATPILDKLDAFIAENEATPTPTIKIEPYTPTATQTATRVPPTATATREPSPTTVPTTPTKPAVVEAPAEVPCSILPQEYCSLAEVIDWTNPKGEVGPVIGLRLPPGVKISLLAPKDGLEIKKIKYSDGNVLKGFQAVASDPDNPTDLQFIFKGDLHFPNLINLSPKKGEIFGYAQNTGVENTGGYTMYFTIQRKSALAENEMRKLFPGAKK